MISTQKILARFTENYARSLIHNYKTQSTPKIDFFFFNSFALKLDLNGWEAIYSLYKFHCRNIHAFDYRVLATNPTSCYITYTYCIIPLQWPVNTIIQDHFWKS